MSTHQHNNTTTDMSTLQPPFFLRQKKRTTRITRTDLSKNNVTLIILNHAKTAIGPKNNNIIFTLKSIKLLT